MFPLRRNLRLKLEQTLFGRNAFSGLRAKARPVICECTEMCDGHSSSKDRNLCLMSSLNLKLFLIAPISPISKWIATYPKAYVCTSENSPRVYTSGEIMLGKNLKGSSHIWESPVFKEALKWQPKLCGWHWESDGVLSPQRGLAFSANGDEAHISFYSLTHYTEKCKVIRVSSWRKSAALSSLQPADALLTTQEASFACDSDPKYKIVKEPQVNEDG